MRTLIIANRAFRTLIASYIRSYNPVGDVIEAGSEQKAIALLREHSFIDVVIIDFLSFPELGIHFEDSHHKLIAIHEKPINPKKLSKFKDNLKKIYA